MARKRRLLSVLLLEDREHLGQVGEIVDVRPGFARNYLLPRGMASTVTADALHRVEQAKKRAVAVRRQRAVEMAAVAAKLEGLRITIEEKASEEGHLFGSVTAAEIVKQLAERDLAVEERHIEMERPIKELGIFSVPVRLGPDQSIEISVWVVEPSA